MFRIRCIHEFCCNEAVTAYRYVLGTDGQTHRFGLCTQHMDQS